LQLTDKKFRFRYMYLSSYLDQETAKGPFQSSIQAAIWNVTTSLTTQRYRNPVKCLAQGHNKFYQVKLR